MTDMPEQWTERSLGRALRAEREAGLVRAPLTVLAEQPASTGRRYTRGWWWGRATAAAAAGVLLAAGWYALRPAHLPVHLPVRGASASQALAASLQVLPRSGEQLAEVITAPVRRGEDALAGWWRQ